MLAGKKLYVLIAAALSMAAGGVGYSYVQHEKNQESFFGDGYVLTLDEAAGETTAAPVYFNAGTKYKVSYPDNVTFKTTDGKKTTLDYTNFVHYADGSIGAVTDGVLMELEQLKNGYINYYNVSSKSIMRKEGDKYILDNQGQELEFKDFVWKLSDSKYLVSSDSMDVVLPNNSNLDTDGFVELNYLDDGIVQVLTDNAAYQVLTSGTTVELGNGMQIDTDTREIENGDTQLMNLASLDVNNSTNISVVPSANQAAMTVPKFNITTIDGVDGETGAAGDEGQIGENGASGEEGQAGEAGQIGENGNTGENGDDGLDGDDGQDGNDGDDGSTGRAGKAGEAGKTGDTGSTGGTGGGGHTGGTAGGGSGSGGSGTTSNGTVMPVVRVEEFHYDSGSVSGTLSVEEGSGVTLGTGTLWITDVQTGKKVKMEEYDLEEAVEINFDSSRLAGSGFHIEAGKEYQVSLEASYVLDRTDSAGNQITGTTNLFMRTFSTNKLGVSETYDHATTNEIYVKVEKAEYSNVKDFKIVYQSVSKEEAESEISKTFDASSRSIDLTLDHDTGLNPDTNYTVKLYAKNPEAVDSSNLWELISTHNYKTLKRAPSIGGKPIVALSPRGYFEIKPGVTADNDGKLQDFSDPDNGIRKYRYEIYTADGSTMVTSVESDNYNPVSVYVDGTNVRYNTNYKAKLVVEFYDNEKTVEYATEFSDIFMLDAENTAPYMMFVKSDTISDPADPREGTESVRSESIDGNLQFYFNHADLNISPSNPLTFEISSEAFVHEKTLYQVFQNTSAQQDYLSVPVNIKGLRQNTTYRFNAYGTYNGDTSSTLLATCIVTTKKPEPLTIHMQEEHSDSHALSVKMYFTDSEDESTKIPLEAYTMYQIKLGLYEGINKVGSADVRFARTDESNKEYSGEAATRYFGSDGKDYLLITNETFNLGAADINNSSGHFEMVVEGGVAYDYTATDDLRFKDELGSPLGTYSNEIPLLGETKTTISPTEVAPVIPEEGMKVKTILNSTAGDFGFNYDSNLPSDAVIGFILTPQYDNTGGYANRADYYMYDRYEYEEYLNGLKSDDQKNDPLANSGKLGSHPKTPLLHYEYDLRNIERSEDGLLPRLIILLGEDPNDTKEDHYTIQKDGDYRGIRYIYADTHNELLKDSSVSGTVERAERGKSYYFPYDVNLTLNENDNYRYPYQYSINGGGNGSYVSTDQIMKNAVPIDAKRAEPVIEMYPYHIENNACKAIWKMKMNDPDGALDLNSFYSRNANSTIEIADFKNLPEKAGGAYFETVGDSQKFLLRKYLQDLYAKEDPWLDVDFTAPKNTGDTTTVALLMKYNALYDGEREGESVDKELTSYVFRKDYIPKFDASIYVNTNMAGTTLAEKQQATIETDNAITFLILTDAGAFDSMNGVTAIAVNVSAGSKKETYYLSYSAATTTAENRKQYRVVLPLSSIKDFMGQPMSITLQAVYEKGAYGYETTLQPSKNNTLFAIMTGAGNYMVENSVQDTLDSVSTRAGSIYDISNFELTADKWKGRKITFGYKGKLLGRTGSVSMSSTATGYQWGDNQDIVFKPLATSDAVIVKSEGSITFNTMKPTISKTTVQPGLTSASFDFDLTGGVEDLLQPNTDVLVKIFKREDDSSDSKGDKLEKTISIPLEKLKDYLVSSSVSGNSYTMKIDGLQKNTRYFIEVSGTLKGSTGSVPFLDTTGKNNYIEFHTLDALKGTALGSTITLPGYQDKMLYGRFGLNTTVGIVFRYDVYEFDGPAWLPDEYTQEQMDEYLASGKLIYTQKALNDNKMFKALPDIYTTNSNLVAFDMWPKRDENTAGNTESLFKPGKYYNIRIRGYQEGTDVNVDEMPANTEVLGDFFLSRSHLLYRSTQDPVARVTSKFNDTDDLNKQSADLAISVSDQGRSLVSDYIGTYEWGTDGGAHVIEVQDRNGKKYYFENGTTPRNDLLSGAYMVRIYEAQYNDDLNHIRTGWTLLDNDYFVDQPTDGYNSSWVGRNLQGIHLQNLKQNTEYRVVVYGAVDNNMDGGTSEIDQKMLQKYLDAQSDSSVVNDTKVKVLTDTIIHTLDSSGIYIDEDKMEVNQTSDSEVAIDMYNSAGLERVKFVEYNFVQEDTYEDGSFDSFYTGPISTADETRIVKKTVSGNAGSITDTWTLKGMSFNVTGRYRVVIKYYGADAAGNQASEPLFSTTKYFRVNSVPVSTTAKVAPKARTSVQLPEMYLTEEDRKKFRIG